MGSNKTWKAKMPNSDLEICQENLDRFFTTMFERQEIWYNRFILKQERPWTKDKILNHGKFTNVYRELDRNSQWQIENVFLKEKNRKELIWKIMLFRFFNEPRFFDWVGEQKNSFKGKLPSYSEYDIDEFHNLLQAYKDLGNNPFTTAYLTNTAKYPGNSRVWSFANKIIPKVHENIPILNKLLLSAKKPEDIIKLLNSMPSISNFMSHEFYQDFTYAPKYSDVQLMKFDQDDFTNVGPGAATGLRLIFPNVPMKDKRQKALIYDLRNLAVDYLSNIGDFKYLGYDGNEYFHGKPKITLHQIEMWLCEYQKYWKMYIGEGKQRSRFEIRSQEITINKVK